MRLQPSRPWTCIVDFERRSALCVAFRADGMHWSELFVEDSNLSLPPDFMVFTDADGLVVVIELRLDEEAQPVRVPPWFNRDLLGAVGLTLHPNVFTLKRLVWWSEHSCAVGGQDDL